MLWVACFLAFLLLVIRGVQLPIVEGLLSPTDICVNWYLPAHYLQSKTDPLWCWDQLVNRQNKRGFMSGSGPLSSTLTHPGWPTIFPSPLSHSCKTEITGSRIQYFIISFRCRGFTNVGATTAAHVCLSDFLINTPGWWKSAAYA